MAAVVAFASGVLFVLGLGIAEMTDPGKITAFLDVGGAWDPSLLVVMATALAVYGTGYRLARRRSKPFLADAFVLPESTAVDGALVRGAALFGAGWGLAGYCPGPALAALLSFRPEPAIFALAMAGGMIVFDVRHRG